jgi:RHS repeat-associated protein
MSCDAPPDGSATYYSGSYIYQGNSLDYILHAEGKYKLGSTDGGYHYNVTDHLGNVRLVVKADANRTILDQTDYYPFGMAMNMSLFSSGQKNLYKYNGKELQEDEIGNGSLDWYDYGARMYDPALGRWNCVDPLSDFFPGISPYNYALNNPIRYIDVYGLGPLDWIFGNKKNKHKRKTNKANKKRKKKAAKGAKPKRKGKKSPNANRKRGYGLPVCAPRVGTSGPQIGPWSEFSRHDFPPAKVSHVLHISDYNPDLSESLEIIDEIILPPIHFDGLELKHGGRITFNRTLDYEFLQTSLLNTENNQQTLFQLLNVLTQNEFLKLRIMGNVFGNPNNVNTQVINFMNNRARAIRRFLVLNGIDPSRIEARPGQANLNPQIGQSTSFELIYPK